MSSWLDISDFYVELAEQIGEHIGETRERVIELALTDFSRLLSRMPLEDLYAYHRGWRRT